MTGREPTSAEERVIRAEMELFTALERLIDKCRKQGMYRAATRAYAKSLLLQAHPCTPSACRTCAVDAAAFDMLWPEEGTDD